MSCAGAAEEIAFEGIAAADARLARLEKRAASLAGVIAAATAEQVELIAEVLEADLWVGWGITSPEHWVALRCGVSPSRARRLVAAARRLADLPQVRAAFAAGEITEDHVAEIARARVRPVHDDQAAGLAKVATVTQLRRGLSGLPSPEPDGPPEATTEASAEPNDQPSRLAEQVQFGFDEAGRWWLYARLEADRGALVETALWAGRDAEFRSQHPDASDDPRHSTPADVCWSDGLVRLAHVGLDGLDPATAGTSAGAMPSHRYQVLVHTDADRGAARLHLGPALPAWLRRQLSCDATVRAWVDDVATGVGLGRRQRVVDSKLRTVIEHRDGGCVVPGCAQIRWLRIHHVVHWEDGGCTDPANHVLY